MAAHEDNENCHHVKNDTKGVRLNLNKFILISCDVTELLRKVSPRRGGGIRLQIRQGTTVCRLS